MPRPSTATGKATAELRSWKRTGNTFEGYVFNDAEKIQQDGSWRKFEALDYVRVVDRGDHLLLQTIGWVYRLDKDKENAD